MVNVRISDKAPAKKPALNKMTLFGGHKGDVPQPVQGEHDGSGQSSVRKILSGLLYFIITKKSSEVSGFTCGGSSRIGMG